MKGGHIITGAAIILTAFIASGIDKYLITQKDGRETLMDEVAIIGTPETGYSIGGISIEDIDKITYCQINSDAPGTIISLPESEQIKGVAVWNNELDEMNNRNVYSAEYICEIAGVPYFTTTSVEEATNNANVILISSPVRNSDISEDNFELLKEFVRGGGIIVSPKINNTTPNDNVKNLFGFSSFSGDGMSTNRYLVTWLDPSIPECSYFDDENEITYSLGRGVYSTGTSAVISTQSFNVPENDGAEVLAKYNNGGNAVIKNQIGDGSVYTFGVEWKNVIQRSQNNKDPDAQRKASNAFEPSADIYPFFLRSVFVDQNDVAAWKFTVPDGYSAVLVPTHDCDSETAYNAMHFLSDYEKSLGLSAHYFLTVHYYRDAGYLSAFYNDSTKKKALELFENGHTVGSHSIGHFPDFDRGDLFPMTVVTKEEYAETCTRGLSGTRSREIEDNLEESESGTQDTKGGSTWAEVILSRDIINEDFPDFADVRAFRSGHLCFNENIPTALEDGGFKYSSCHSASDVLSEFPYFQRLWPDGNGYKGDLTNVIQMPLHISDVFNNPETPIDEEHYKDRVEDWWNVFNRLKNNYASSILLIHPNREWKMWAQRELIDKFDREEVGLYNFQDYGDFWINRFGFTFETAYDKANKKVILKTTRENYEKNPHLGIMIEVKETPEMISLIDENGTVLPSSIKKMDDNKFLVLLK
ncbi:MAG: hypothetical protein J1E99_03415 [Muribaculaceae bacterium]|nr:hypothetical protein [Muribaculaceae bacterium]